MMFEFSEETMNRLFALISNKVGFDVFCEEFKVDVDNQRLKFVSCSVLGRSGVFMHGLKDVWITNFSNGMCEDGKKFWTQVNLSFKLNSGGSNGVSLFEAYYNFETEKWSIS